MAIYLAQEWVPPISGSNSSSSSNSGEPTTAGSLLLAYVFTAGLNVGAVTITDDGANTWVEAGHVGDGNSIGVTWLFYCANAAAITSITANLTDAEDQPLVNEHCLLGVVEFGGVEQAAPMSDVDTGVPIAPATLQVTTSPAAAGDLVFGVGGLGLTNRVHELVEGSPYNALTTFRSGGKQVVSAWGLAADTADAGPTWEITSGTNNSAIALVTATFKAGDGSGPGPLSVDAGADQSIYVGQTASVSASASGGTAPYSYAWTVVSGSGSFLNSNQASTTFTPTGSAGVRVLRCIVTDANSTVAQDDLTLTVTQAPSMVGVAEVNDATGWTATGGTVKDVLNDTSDSTGITSMDNPVDQILDVTVDPVTIQEGQHFVTRVRARRGTSATTATVTGYLYTGTTLHSTVTARPIPGSYGDVDLTFPADEIENITPQQWTDGVRVVTTVTATS